MQARTLLALLPLVFTGCTVESSADPSPAATQSSTGTPPATGTAAPQAAPKADAVAFHFVLDTPPDCEGCVGHIKSVVEKLDGFSELVATPQEREIVVKVDPAKLDAQQVLAALTANDRPGKIKP